MGVSLRLGGEALWALLGQEDPFELFGQAKYGGGRRLVMALVDVPQSGAEVM